MAFFKGLYGVMAILLLSACGGGSAPAVPAQHRQESLTFRHDTLPQRDYILFMPASATDQAPLLVFLHGCTQSAEDALLGTGFNQLAVEMGFVVAYPDQKNPNDLPPGEAWLDAHLNDGNGADCWSSGQPTSIVRDSGEAGTLAGITREIIARPDLNIDPQRVYIMGFSGGGFMTSVMAATYPDLYAAAGIVAGCSYMACTDLGGIMAYQAMGEYAVRMPVILFHGSADEIIPYPLGRDALQQWLATNDWIDNGQTDASLPYTPAAIRQFYSDAASPPDAPPAGTANTDSACLYYPNSPCLGGTAGWQDYPHTIEYYGDAEGCLLAEFWTLHGLTHNFPAGNREGSFTDPLGPDIKRAAMAFFLAQTSGQCVNVTEPFAPDLKVE